MDITIKWQRPIRLTKSKKIIVDYSSLPPEVTEVPGVYYFSRRFGPDFTPFYIGQTLNLRSRLRDHLQAASIVAVLNGHYAEDKQVAQGARYYHYGIFVGKQKQDAKKCIKIVERKMIRKAVEEGLPILNKSLTKIKTHSIDFRGSSHGRGWFERKNSVEA